MAAQKDFPTQRQGFGVHPGVHENVGSTVGRQRVVKLGIVHEGVNFSNIVEENPSSVFDRTLRSIEVHLFGRVLADNWYVTG